MLDLTDVARIATLLIPPLALLAALCAFLAGGAGPSRSGKVGPMARLHAAASGSTLTQALRAAASLARTIVAAAAVLATGVLIAACVRNDRSFTAVRDLPSGHDAVSRLLALATAGQGAAILAMLLLSLVGIAPARLIAVTTTRIAAPLLAALAACLCIWALDPFGRAIPIVERSAADAGTQYGVALLAIGALGMCAAVCLRPVFRATRVAPAVTAGSGMPLTRAERLAAIEQEVRAARERGGHETGTSAAAGSLSPSETARWAADTGTSHCTRCQASLPSGAGYCTTCGLSIVRKPDPVEATCRTCGTPRAEGDIYCARCGTPLAGSVAGEGRAKA